jgi:hypothetical protein
MPRPSVADAEARLRADLGLKPLSPAWAKAEIFLGIASVSAGHLCGIYAIVHLAEAAFWALIVASLLLQTLGGYLGLAGHRSHVYQSQNKLAAWLATQSASQSGGQDSSHGS